jgi:hypothetical protein
MRQGDLESVAQNPFIPAKMGTQNLDSRFRGNERMFGPTAS